VEWCIAGKLQACFSVDQTITRSLSQEVDMKNSLYLVLVGLGFGLLMGGCGGSSGSDSQGGGNGAANDSPVVFMSDGASTGYEPHVLVDGMPTLLAEVNADGPYSGVNGIGETLLTNSVYYNGKYYFRATDGASGYELWVSDGTVGGTELVRDIYPGVNGSEPSNLVVCNNLLYFSANDRTNGNELWVSNGSEGGTLLVKDIRVGEESSSPSSLVVYGDRLYFSADDGTNGPELWVSNGTAETTFIVKDINVGAVGSFPQYLTVYNELLYFNAYDEERGAELWVSNGLAGGTRLLADINPDVADSSPGHLAVYSDRLYFRADDGLHGEELWVMDREERTSLVEDLFVGGTSSYPYYLTVYDGDLYFRGGSDQDQLYVFDGTTISEVSAFVEGEEISTQFLFAADDRLYVVSASETFGDELVVYDGVTVEVVDYNEGVGDGLNFD
jgi:ELWxxDGT repeat protein